FENYFHLNPQMPTTSGFIGDYFYCVQLLRSLFRLMRGKRLFHCEDKIEALQTPIIIKKNFLTNTQ
ncbi:MAG TPA: hypothetical protein PKZ69_05250, partial [Candidatus Cloacimonadota bacterium]|nr:hypothetical protein [Candidatus Cloacimonadota bacterium]